MNYIIYSLHYCQKVTYVSVLYYYVCFEKEFNILTESERQLLKEPSKKSVLTDVSEQRSSSPTNTATVNDVILSSSSTVGEINTALLTVLLEAQRRAEELEPEEVANCCTF